MSQRAKPEPRVTSEATVPEPSIDEILASIRRSIVSEDAPAGRPAQRRSRRQADAAAGGAAVPAGRDPPDRAGTMPADGADGAGAADDGPLAAANGREDPPACTGMARRGNRGGDGTAAVAWQADGPLMSPRTAAAVDTAFGALRDTVVTHNPPTLEDLAREMLRPMLKAWLDANLPGMVERLVQAEIERVSRGG